MWTFVSQPYGRMHWYPVRQVRCNLRFRLTNDNGVWKNCLFILVNGCDNKKCEINPFMSRLFLTDSSVIEFRYVKASLHPHRLSASHLCALSTHLLFHISICLLSTELHLLLKVLQSRLSLLGLLPLTFLKANQLLLFIPVTWQKHKLGQPGHTCVYTWSFDTRTPNTAKKKVCKSTQLHDVN